MFEADELEQERLDFLGQTFDEGTFGWLGAFHPRPGWRCLDIGSGTGGVARWLSDACGNVVATDLDTDHLLRRPYPGVRVLRHDVTREEFPEGSFELIHARWVFMHLADRQQILRRAVRWLAPGGWLLLQDGSDFAEHSTLNPRYDAMWSAINQIALDNIGTDLDWARSFPAPLARAGLERLGVDVEVSIVGTDRPMTGFLLHVLRRLEKLLLASGHTEADLAAWREMVTHDGFHDLGMANVAAWGRRPL